MAKIFRKENLPAHAEGLKATSVAKDDKGVFTGVIVPENPAKTHRGTRGTAEQKRKRRKQL